MKNPFKRKLSENKPFKFTDKQLVVFKNFLRATLPLMVLNWPRSENRPKFEGMPNYKLVGMLEDYESGDEATSSVFAVFEDVVAISGMGTGNAIVVRRTFDIDEIFIQTYETKLVGNYLDYVESADNKGK